MSPSGVGLVSFSSWAPGPLKLVARELAVAPGLLSLLVLSGVHLTREKFVTFFAGELKEGSPMQPRKGN